MIDHTTTNDAGTQGPGLWDSTHITPGGSFNLTFNNAGVFSYHCAIHPSMLGTITILMDAGPPTGSRHNLFGIAWGIGSIPPGFNADVQIKRPGKPFKDWMVNQTGTQTSANFQSHRKGTYQFRSRLQSNSPGGATAYTPSVEIKIR